MKKITLIILLGVFSMNAQKFVDLSEELSNITHGMVINGNDYSLTEQVIINTSEINFKKPAYIRFYNVLLNVNGSILGQGKFNLLENSRIYVKDRGSNSPTSKLYSRKPFGEDIVLEKCSVFNKVKDGTPYTLWYTNGKKYKKGFVGDGTIIKRMFYNVKIGKKYLDKQLLTN